MSRPDSEKCRLCSKLTTTDAKRRHGSNGSCCWDDAHCHNRRSYYRHRSVRNYNRKQHRQQQPQAVVDSTLVVTLSIPVPAAPAAIAYWYRETKTSSLHALGAELWIGNTIIAKIEPVHCLGLAEMQIKTLLVRILDGFSQHCGIKIERFRSSVELNPLNCPIRSCPLHPGSELA